MEIGSGNKPSDGEPRMEAGNGWVSRRKLLAAAGLAAAAVVCGRTLAGAGQGGDAVFSAVYGEATEEDCCCEQATISRLRTDASINAQTLYWVTDPEREGWFYPDPSDTVSPDNTGTVLISEAGLRLKRYMPLQTLNAKWFGAAGDGVIDDTDAIQAALDAIPDEGGTVWISHGDYRIDALIGLKPKSRTKLSLASGTVLRALPNASERYNVILIASQTDVTVQGGTIVGERQEHLGTTGEWGMGISILSSSHVTILDTTIRDCWGDGIYLGYDSTKPGRVNCQNITIRNVTCDNNRRQGLSVTACIGGLVENSSFINTNGTAPQSGIDIEPNNGVRAEHFRVVGCRCSNNAGNGILVYGVTDTNCRYNTLDGNSCLNNGRMGIEIRGASHIRVLHNQCNDNGMKGIRLAMNTRTAFVQYNEIASNTAARNGAQGISVEGEDGIETFSHNVIRDNCAYQNVGEGINLIRARHTRVTGNQFIGNVFGIRLAYAWSRHNELKDNQCVNNQIGIKVMQCEYNGVHGNQCSDNLRNGIYINQASDNAVTGNTCSGNGLEASGTYDHILLDAGSSRNQVRANTLHKGAASSARYGIHLAVSGCEDNWVSDNELLEAALAAGLNDQGTGTVDASMNRM